MIPDRIGRYEVQSVLGAGGFATVFLARDPVLDALVAIKLLADNMARDDEFRDRFVREARMMRQLETPGLVTVYDIGDHNGVPYFVMEYCERGTLADRIDGLGRPLSQAEGYQLAAAITASTGHIHRAGMVHRDLKPSNYLIRARRHTGPAGGGGNAILSSDEELAVADFGLAKVVDLNASFASIAGGTPGYSAPEQFRGDPSVDASADVYAASAMIAAAVTGRQPKPVLAPGDTAYEMAELAAAGPMAQELARGLAVDKSQRHSDINVWYQNLTTSVSAPASSQDTMAAPSMAPPTQVPSAHQYPPPGAGTPPPTPAAPVQPATPPPTPMTAAPAGAATPAPVNRAPVNRAPVTPQPVPGPQGFQAGQVDRVQPFSGGEPPTAQGAPRTGQETGSKSGRGRLVGIGFVVLLAIGGAIALAASQLGAGGGTDAAITGPTIGLVGQEMVFASTDGSSGTWTVDNTEFVGSSIAVTPSTAGWVEINFTGADDDSVLLVTAIEDDGADGTGTGLSIAGPGMVVVGQSAVFSAVGADSGTWTANGESFDGASVELSPSTAGTITVGFESATGSVERVVTAVGAG